MLAIQQEHINLSKKYYCSDIHRTEMAIMIVLKSMTEKMTQSIKLQKICTAIYYFIKVQNAYLKQKVEH